MGGPGTATPEATKKFNKSPEGEWLKKSNDNVLAGDEKEDKETPNWQGTGPKNRVNVQDKNFEE